MLTRLNYWLLARFSRDKVLYLYMGVVGFVTGAWFNLTGPAGILVFGVFLYIWFLWTVAVMLLAHLPARKTKED